MAIETLEEAINYLRGLDAIIIPTQYTYFHHSTSYQAEAIQMKEFLKKSWTRMPIDEFTIKREMSFVERTERIREALEYGSRKRANLIYSKPKNSKEFSIRVIMPKLRLSDEDKEKLGITPERFKRLAYEYRGLGDGRHAKLGHGEHIIMFACSQIDEVSEEKADILYGIREQDLIPYAKTVMAALEIKPQYDGCFIPEPVQEDGRSSYDWDRNYQFERETYAIPKEPNFRRYERKGVLGPSNEVVLYELSEFEKEYMDELMKTYTTTEDVNISRKTLSN